MLVTDVQVKLATESVDGLIGYVSFTFDHCFMVHEAKLVRNRSGSFFVSMPARKRQFHCPNCDHRNFYFSNYCNRCGVELPDTPLPLGGDGTQMRLWADIVHPITSPCRSMIHDAVVAAYRKEAGLASMVSGAMAS